MLGLLGALPPLAIDISAPTLLVVQTQMGATARSTGLIITMFMVGFALGQLGGGPLSDRYGRRPVLLIGLLSYATASIGCALAHSITTLLAWRAVQGVGAGACAVLTFAMIRDLFEGDQARAKRSYVTVVFGVAPMLAPLLGALILDVLGWRSVYLTLAGSSVLLLLAIMFGVAESRAPLLQPPSLALITSYRSVLTNRRFTSLVVVNAFSFAAIFAYIAASPLVLMGSFHLAPSGYGEVFACTAAVLTSGAWVSGRCAQRGISCNTLLWAGLSLGAAGALCLGLLLARGSAGVGLILPPLLLVMFTRGLIAPNLQHTALEPMRELAGTAAAAIGVIQILAGVLSSAVIAVLFPLIGAQAMGVTMAVAAVCAFGMWIWTQARPA